MNLGRIEGIYNQDTIKHVSLLGIKSWLFDFRPKSFSFIQQYRFLEILEKSGEFAENIFMLFNREKKETLESFLDIVSKVATKKEVMGKLKLEFDDFLDNDDFDRYGVPFYLRVNRSISFENLKKYKYCEGLVLDFKYLSSLHETDELLFFAQNLSNFRESHSLMKLILSADWDSNLFHSLDELIPFNYLSMPINSKVESSYRTVDISVLSSNSQYFLRDRNEHTA